MITSNYKIEELFNEDKVLQEAIKGRFTVIKIPERGRFEQENNIENNIIYNRVEFNNLDFIVGENETKENI